MSSSAEIIFFVGGDGMSSLAEMDLSYVGDFTCLGWRQYFFVGGDGFLSPPTHQANLLVRYSYRYNIW